MGWIDMIATFVVATLAGMGIGSGGLMVIYLTLIRGTEQLVAQGFNLLFFLFASASSMVIHLSRRKIFWLAVGIMIAAGLPCAYLGTRTAVLLPSPFVRSLFGLFLIAVSIPSLFGTKQGKKVEKT